MSAHTPGPWKVKDREVMEDGSVYPCHVVGGIAEFQVCQLESAAWAQLSTEQPALYPYIGAVLQPNARLIAAAPDLIDALHNLEVSANTVGYCYDKRPENFAAALASLKDDAEKARAALAKARGEA